MRMIRSGRASRLTRMPEVGNGSAGTRGLSTQDWRLFLVLGSATVLGPASMDIYLPGLPELSRDLNVSPSEAQLTVTTFLIGLALGQLLAGPLSDVYGRRRPLIGAMAAFTVASLLCALAPNLSALSALRLMLGTMGAAGMAIGRAIVRDLSSGAAAARYLSRLVLLLGLSPLLAPSVGAQILEFTSWRGVFVALAVLGFALFLTTVKLLPETLPREHRRARGLGATGRTFAALLRTPRFLGFTLICGFTGGAMVAYVAGSSFLFEGVYGTSSQVYGLLFGLNAVFMVVGAQINAHLLGRLTPRRLLEFGLTAMTLAGVGLLVVVVLAPGAGVIAVIPPTALLQLSWSFVQANLIALALTNHPRDAGTAAALLGVSQYAIGAVVAPVAGLGGNHSALPMATVITGCGLAAVLTLRAIVPTLPRSPIAATAAEA